MSKVANRLVFLWLSTIILSYVGCEIYNDITTTADVSTDFSRYKTFAWQQDKADSSNQPYNNEIIRNNLKNYFNESFAERGYILNLDTPDVFLRLLITNKKKEKVNIYYSYPLPYYYGNYYYGGIYYYYPYDFNFRYRYPPFYYYPYNYISDKYEYIEGSIILNVFDRRQNKLVWTGTARGDIYNPAYIYENLQPAVDAIMRNYPLKPLNKIKKRNNNETDNIYN